MCTAKSSTNFWCDPQESANVKRNFHLYAYENLTLDGLVERSNAKWLDFRDPQSKFPRSTRLSQCDFRPTGRWRYDIVTTSANKPPSKYLSVVLKCRAILATSINSHFGATRCGAGSAMPFTH